MRLLRVGNEAEEKNPDRYDEKDKREMSQHQDAPKQ
jgi:hypothetical protein